MPIATTPAGNGARLSNLPPSTTPVEGTGAVANHFATLALLACLTPAFAVADERPSPNSDSSSPASANAAERDAGLDTILVTAEKRSESIQKVPISITAMDNVQLERMQIKSTVDLTKVVSNLSLKVGGVAGYDLPVYSIRGINTADASPGQNGPVAVYYDEVYKGSIPLQGIAFFDLARIEVLKGPQGTLYGKNTTGGAINLVSRVPDFSTQADATIGFGNYNHFHAAGGAQTAITDTVAVRLAFTTDHADGWFTNTAPDSPNTNSTDNYAIRSTILFKPSDNFNLVIRGIMSRTNPIGSYRGWMTKVPGGLLGPPYYPATGAGGVVLEPIEGVNPRYGYQLAPRRNNGAMNAVSATATWRVADQLDLSSLTSYDRGSLVFRTDSNQPLAIIGNTYFSNTTQVSQDLRLTSHFDGPGNFILGAYYNREAVHARNSTYFSSDIDVNGDGVVNAADCIASGFAKACSRNNDFEQIKQSIAAYTDASYELTEQWKFHAGLRFTHDKGDIPHLIAYYALPDGSTVLKNNIPGPGGGTASAHFTDSNVSGRLGVDYNVTNDIMLYASANRGYRGSAFNNQAYSNPAELNTAPAETLTSYEMGFKTQMFSNRLRLNGAAFDMEYKNQQVLTFNAATLANILASLSKSRVRGAELSVDARIAGGLSTFATLGLLNTRILSGAVSGVDRSGRPLQNAPSVTASVGFDWEQALGERFRYNVSFDGGYTGRQRFDLDNNPLTIEHGHFLLNGRLRFGDSSDRLGIALWSKNLLNKYYPEYLSPFNPVGGLTVIPNEPRMYGVSVDAKF